MTAADFNLTALKSNVHTKSSGVSASGLLYVRGGGIDFSSKTSFYSDSSNRKFKISFEQHRELSLAGLRRNAE